MLYLRLGKNILLMLDLPIWNFTLFRFKTKLVYTIFIDLGLDINHL